jgi:hypothetical protein
MRAGALRTGRARVSGSRSPPVDAALEALDSLIGWHWNDEHDEVLIGERWYPRWRLEEIAQKYREFGGNA